MEKIELEQENKLLKSFLYCTKKSCNNCGNVNCENFQRQRKDCCERWISFKDRIIELEGKLTYLNEFHSNCVEAFVSQSPRDDYEMACAGRDIFELLYPDDERLKDIYK